MFFQENGQYRCAVYLRLSRSDGDQQESNSIKNQRALLNDYLGKHPELHKVDEYVDDGYSGTNFERPDFKRMMQDIENRKINCIIVKDLSRFGRNYIETGRYLERIFPFMGVRFIAINDHYDSAEDNDDKGRILIPFNNLINDTYCRDISMRVRSHLDVKRKEGQFIGSFAGYGYQKDPKDKNHLIIDEYAAGIVQEIFKQKLNGMSSQRIASYLNKLGVLPPNEYKRANGFNYTCGFQAGLNQKWTVVSVNRILKNESYTGTLIQGKRRKINYKVKKSHDVGSENWIRVEDQGMQEKQSITVRCVDIEDLEKQAEAIRVEQIKLYESYADGVLRRDVYIEKKKTLSEKLAALQDSIRTEKEEQECADELDEEIRNLTKQASQKTYIGGLTKECVDAFVSMVYLYDDQTMKVEFNCEDVIRRALEKYGA